MEKQADKHIEQLIDSILDDKVAVENCTDLQQERSEVMDFVENVVEATHRKTMPVPDIDEAWDAFGHKHYSKSTSRKWVWWATASVAILLSVAAITLWNGNTDGPYERTFHAARTIGDKTALNSDNTIDGNIGIVTVATSKEGTKAVTLPDGSEVYLNSQSSISYPKQFIGKERVVELSGEAYLKVSHNASMPFVVRHGKVTTRVLGTEFNIKSRAGSDTHVTLVSGKVEVTFCGVTKTLIPDQDACIGSNGIVVTSVNPLQFTGWHCGVVYFDDASLKEVMDDIGERYGLDVLFCDKSLSEQRFHCMYSVNDSLDHVLDIIKSSSDLNINVVGNTIFIE